VSGLLSKALDTQRGATALECVKALGRRGGAESVGLLTDLLTSASKPEHPLPGLAVEAARALGCIGDASAERPLVAALGSASNLIAMAAAEALGRMGSVHAVRPLRGVELRAAATGVRSVARQAVAEIQARLRGASQGQLSLADGEEGRLSIVDGERGQLSFAGEAKAPRDDPQRSAGRRNTTQ
jgi:HEAT repeat protein